MRNESLISSVVGILSGQEVITPSPDLMPDVEQDVQLHLGKPDPVIAEVRARLKELHDDAKAELVEKRNALIEKRDAELLIVEEGDKSVAQLTAEGKTREEIIHARSAQSVAAEIAGGIEHQIDAVDDEIARIDKNHYTKRDRVIKGLEGIETAARAWLLDFVQGGNTNRLNPDRSQRAYGQMLSRESFIRETLDDDELAERAILACGTFVCPSNVWETLFAVMPDRYHAGFEDDTPEIVLARLQYATTGDSE